MPFHGVMTEEQLAADLGVREPAGSQLVARAGAEGRGLQAGQALLSEISGSSHGAGAVRSPTTSWETNGGLYADDPGIGL